jgi:hypothetical protein
LLYDIKYRIAAGAVKENLSAFPEWHKGNLFACFNLPKRWVTLYIWRALFSFPNVPRMPPANFAPAGREPGGRLTGERGAANKGFIITEERNKKKFTTDSTEVTD